MNRPLNRLLPLQQSHELVYKLKLSGNDVMYCLAIEIV